MSCVPEVDFNKIIYCYHDLGEKEIAMYLYVPYLNLDLFYLLEVDFYHSVVTFFTL